MKPSKVIFTVLFVALFGSISHAGEEVDRLLAQYKKVETVSCRIRRTVEGEAGKIRFLSQIYYTNQDKIHVENVTPVRRTTLADGKTLYQYGEGDPKGFSRPIPDLSDEMTLSLRKVPGTPMNHLFRLKGFEEKNLPLKGSETKRIGIVTPNQYVVLLLDEKGRLTHLKFYKTSGLVEQIATYIYSNHQEVLPVVWIPFLHQGTLATNGNSFEETIRVDRFVANKPVADSLFIATSFFDKSIDFVDDFAKIYPN